jgi:PQQ-like domain
MTKRRRRRTIAILLGLAVLLAPGARQPHAVASGAPAAPARSQTRYFVELRLADGTVAATLPQPSGGGIEDIAPDGRGGWFVAGFFESIGGVDCSYLAHVLPTGQIDPGWCPHTDDYVQLVARAGNNLYVTGGFHRVAGIERAGYAAFDLTTGNVTPWQVPRRSQLGAEVLAAGGEVVVVAASYLERKDAVVAAFDGRTGRPLPWRVRFDNGCRRRDRDCATRIEAILVRGTSVYVAGFFKHVRGRPHVGLVALDARTGRLLPWRANVERAAVDSFNIDVFDWNLGALGPTVYVSGGFGRVNGVPRPQIAALDGRTGRVQPWKARLPAGLLAVDGFAVTGSAVVLAYDYATKPSLEAIGLAVRRVDRTNGRNVRWTYPGPWQVEETAPLVLFVGVSGENVLVQYFSGSA